MHNHEPRLTLAAELRRLERDAEGMFIWTTEMNEKY